MKLCSRCRESYPETAFYRSAERLSSRCKTCVKDAARASQKAHAEERRDYLARYYQANRTELIARSAARAKDVPAETRRAWAKRSRENNREKRKAYNDEYRRARLPQFAEYRQIRRARERGATIAPVDRQAIIERDGWRCHICSTLTTTATVSLDHLVPIARGGAHAPENLRVAHRACNSRRNAYGPAQLLIFG